MWFVTRSQTWRRWWRVSRIMQQPCSNHFLCGQVLPLVLMPQNSRITMTSGRKSTPSLNVTRYLEEEMMSNSQLTCLESIFQSWQRGPLTSESPFFKCSLLLFLLDRAFSSNRVQDTPRPWSSLVAVQQLLEAIQQLNTCGSDSRSLISAETCSHTCMEASSSSQGGSGISGHGLKKPQSLQEQKL